MQTGHDEQTAEKGFFEEKRDGWEGQGQVWEVWLFLFIVQPGQEVFTHFFRPEWS